MRVVLAALTLFSVGIVSQPAQADPYRWCAEMGGGRGGGYSSCSFITWEQCQAHIHGLGGFCVINQFYDGQPVRTPEDRPVHRSRRPRS